MGNQANGNDVTMLLNLDCPNIPYTRTIRHEFGHALGIHHEHQNPNAPKLFDEKKLEKFLRSRGVSDENIPDKIKTQWRRLSSPSERPKSNFAYDKDSVMHYV